MRPVMRPALQGQLYQHCDSKAHARTRNPAVMSRSPLKLSCCHKVLRSLKVFSSNLEYPQFMLLACLLIVLPLLVLIDEKSRA